MDDTAPFLAKSSPAGAFDCTHIALAFKNNQEANLVFGPFDEHLKYIEQALNIEIRVKGNELELLGSADKLEHARQIFDFLMQHIKNEKNLQLADIKSAIALTHSIDPGKGDTSLNKEKKLTSSHTALVKAQISTRKKTIYARTKAQDAYIRALERSELVFGVGPAGTGKTYLAVAYAAQLLEHGVVEKIILSRPAVEAGERLGFLPGDMKEKDDPYLRPLYDALYDMIPFEKVDRALASGIIEIAPLAFMRGRSLTHCAIILDEAQNTSSMQMKMFLTRLGEGARMIVTGDPSQIDLPTGQKSGLIEAMHILKNVDPIIFVQFSEKDIIRHPIVTSIVKAYDKARKKEEKD